jgi:hypothetical protein
MYLIKGNVVILREFESGYYLAEYTTQNNKKIIKWVDEDAIDFEESK